MLGFPLSGCCDLLSNLWIFLKLIVLLLLIEASLWIAGNCLSMVMALRGDLLQQGYSWRQRGDWYTPKCRTSSRDGCIACVMLQGRCCSPGAGTWGTSLHQHTSRMGPLQHISSVGALLLWFDVQVPGDCSVCACLYMMYLLCQGCKIPGALDSF